MRKYLLLVVATLAFATDEAAHACANHNKSKTELQAKFGGDGRRMGGGVETKNRQGSGSVLDAKFFEKLDQTGSRGAAFNAGFGSDEAKPE